MRRTAPTGCRSEPATLATPGSSVPARYPCPRNRRPAGNAASTRSSSAGNAYLLRSYRIAAGSEPNYLARRQPPRRFHHFVRRPAEEKCIGMGGVLDGVTMQFFVRDHLTMIAATVQCD